MQKEEGKRTMSTSKQLILVQPFLRNPLLNPDSPYNRKHVLLNERLNKSHNCEAKIKSLVSRLRLI